VNKILSRSTAKTSRHCSVETSATAAAKLVPALLTKAITRPHLVSIARRNSTISSSGTTSTTKAPKVDLPLISVSVARRATTS